MTTDENLFKAFAPFGNLREGKQLTLFLGSVHVLDISLFHIISSLVGYAAKVVIDRGSGKSRGFGFVSYETVEEAEKAREGMNAKFLDGWVIFVDPAKPREAPQQPPPRRDMQSSETGFTTNWTVGWKGY